MRDSEVTVPASVREFLARLRTLDVRVWLDGEHLRCSAPTGVLSPDLRDELRTRREQIRLALGGSVADGEAGIVAQEGASPLSFAQERLWFFHQLEPASSAYNMSAVLTLSGPLDVPALERSLSAIVQRHEILRTTFVQRNGEPSQQVHPASPWRLRIEDLASQPRPDREGDAELRWKLEAEAPFDLAAEFPFRALLVRLGHEEHHLVITMHHIASDGASLVIVMRELVAHYTAFHTGKAVALPALPGQYAGYARRQRQWIESPGCDATLAYWTRQLAGTLPVLDLPADYPRPAIQTYRGVVAHAKLSPEISARLRGLSQRHGCTLFMTLLAAFKALLWRHTGEDDVVVGSPVAGRDRPETRDLVGMFVNTLVLRTDLTGNPSFEELLARVRNTCLKAFANQELPFARLVEALRPERDQSRTALFQVMFNMFTLDADDVAYVEGLTIRPPALDRLLAAFDGQSKFDLTLYAHDQADGIQLILVYNADLFGAARMEALLGDYRRLVETVALAPRQPLGDMALVGSGASPRTVIAHARRPGLFEPLTADFVNASIVDRFAQVVARHAEAVAIAGNGERWTYRQLDGMSSAIASSLHAAAGGAVTRVGLLCDPGAPMVSAVLGVLKQGSAYVPLDPSFPEDRLLLLLDDAGATVLLAEPRYAKLAAHLARGQRMVVRTDDPPPDPPATTVGAPLPGSLAYVLYTSGSSGRPKGVSQNHGNVLHYVRAYANAIELVPGDRLTLVASYTFDASVVDMFSALLAGATLYPVDLAAGGLHGIARQLEEDRITVYHSTPTLYRALGPHLRPESVTSVRCVVLGGEKVEPRDVALFRQHFPPGSFLVNLYGATEATIALLEFVGHEAPELGSSVSIGYPVDATGILLLDSAGEPAPVRGEIALKSRFLALGYWNEPDLTRQVFLPAPDDPSVRIYRTGDLGLRRPDGAIEFLGRKDQQVKIRGIRIELGEIEAALARHPGVSQCAVTADGESGSGDRVLIGFAVLSAPGAATPAELKDHLARTLPAYMVPAALVILEELPLTRTGKIDRRALPKLETLGLGDREQVIAPRTAIEQVLAEIWGEVLDRQDIGVHDDFFGLGGNSLNATQAVARLRTVLGRDVPLRVLFSAPTIAGMASALGADGRAGAEPDYSLHPLRRAEGPLSYSQERMWFLQQLDPASTAYNMVVAVSLRGALDRAALLASLAGVVARHEILRTTFTASSGEPRQRVAAEPTLELLERDLQDLPVGERLATAKAMAAEDALRPFDLERGPLLRAQLIHVAQDEHILVLTLHHIAGDLWSFGVLGNELARLYNARLRGDAAPLPPLEVQYADFASWHRTWLAGPRLDQQLAFWKTRLAQLEPIELPADRPRPAFMSFDGRRVVRELSPDLAERIRALSLREGVTPFMTLLAAFNVLLHRYTGRTDVAVGVPIANRTRVEVEQLIGTFVNTLVHRNDLSGNPSFHDVLQRVRATAIDAFVHQDLPFERLVRELVTNRDPSRSPLFQVMFNMANAPMRQVELGGVSVVPINIERYAAQFDLGVTASLGERSAVAASYNVALFDHGTIERFLDNFVTLLDAVTAAPATPIARLAVMPAETRRALLVDWNNSDADMPDLPVTELIAAQAGIRPTQVAVEHEGQRLTYAELEMRATRLARHLRAAGAGAGSLVGVCLNRSTDMLVALLAVMKAGAAYVPLDPSYPSHRIRFMLEDSAAGVVVTETSLDGLLGEGGPTRVLVDADHQSIAQHSADTPLPVTDLDSLAYVIYTSGSTGKPKGVQLTHRALANFLVSMREQPGMGEGDVLLAVTTISFDIAGLELYLPLLVGGTVVIASRVVSADGERLLGLLRKRRPDLMQATPATWRGLIEAGWREGESPSLKALCGGEALPRALAEGLVARAGQVWNLYGPTETTIWSTLHRVVSEPGPVAIGRPIANTSIYVLDGAGEPVPIGVPGEIHIGGVGVAVGYLNRPELTAERFIADPFSAHGGMRMYRSGDQGRYRADGVLEHLGRLDHQVKLRGYRIELGEIEAALAACPIIRQQVVEVRQERLVAYVVFAEGESMTVTEIREFLRDTLPDFMVPSLVVALDRIPLTPNGKVDRAAIPDPLRLEQRTGAFAAPETPTERVIADVWCEILGVDRVGTGDNFFELGGHSLLSIRAIHAIQQRTGWRPDPRLLFFRSLGQIAASRVVPGS